MIKHYDENMSFEKINFELSDKEKKRLNEIMTELKEMFNAQTVSIGYPDGISGNDYQDIIITLNKCYIPYMFSIRSRKE